MEWHKPRPVERGNLLSFAECLGLTIHHLNFFNFLLKCYVNKQSFTVSRNPFGLPSLGEYKDAHGREIPHSTAYRIVKRYYKRGAILRDYTTEQKLNSPMCIFTPNPVFIEFLGVLLPAFTEYLKITKEERR